MRCMFFTVCMDVKPYSNPVDDGAPLCLSYSRSKRRRIRLCSGTENVEAIPSLRNWLRNLLCSLSVGSGISCQRKPRTAGEWSYAADCPLAGRNVRWRTGCAEGGALMRTATHSPTVRTAMGHRKKAPCSVTPRISASHRLSRDTQRSVLVCAAVFLMGYFPGVLTGGTLLEELGRQLGNYYMDDTCFSSWKTVFSGQMASCFLQLILILMCGFCAFGTVALLLLFAVKGFFLGFCSASTLMYGGLPAFGKYWVTGCLPNVFFLFMALWLSGYAICLSQGLFQSVFLGGAPRGQLASNCRRLTTRFLICIPLSGLISAFCSTLVLFARKVL